MEHIMASNDMGTSATDQGVVDAIATMLGTAERWSADELETIGNLIGQVRPHPGDAWEDYAAQFRAATGRTAPSAWIDNDYDGPV
jgi:hypothetical protein